MMENLSVITVQDIAKWIGTVLALLVSLLTLYNAAKLRTGVLAMSTYAFGAGMLSLAGGFLFLMAPGWDPETVALIHRSLFILGFILLGIGSYRIYRMSQIK